MQLVDKQNDTSLAGLDGVEDGLQPLLELAAELGAGDQGAHVQGEDLPVLQVFGHVAPDDPLGQALCDGGLAHAGLTDEHRVVLGLPGQDADHVANLAVAADDRVQLLRPGPLHQILAVFLQHIIGLLRVVGGDPLVAPHVLQRSQKPLLGDLKSLEQLLDAAFRILDQAQEDMLHRNEVILHAAGLLFGGVEGLVKLLGNINFIRLPAAAADLGQRAHRAGHGGGKAVHRHAHPVDELADEAVLLLQQGQQHMGLAHLLVSVFHRQALGRLDSLDAFLGKLIEIHKKTSCLSRFPFSPGKKPRRRSAGPGHVSAPLQMAGYCLRYS